MTTRTIDSMGKQAKTMNKAPALKATHRLVTPVAMESPILLDDVVCPTPPRSPADSWVKATARMPPCTECMSVRTHLASLIF